MKAAITKSTNSAKILTVSRQTNTSFPEVQVEQEHTAAKMANSKTEQRLDNFNSKVGTTPSIELGNSWARPMYGINKHGVSRAVVHFRNKPPPAPLSVCLHYPDTTLSHKHLLKLVKATLERIPDAEVKSIHFIDRNVFFGARDIENRWIVTVNCNRARDELIRTGIVLFEKKMQFKKYDDILTTEFDQFMRHKEHKKDMLLEMIDISGD